MVYLSRLTPRRYPYLGIYTILWGLWVANPFWDVFSTAPLYSQLSSIAPEVFWGTAGHRYRYYNHVWCCSTILPFPNPGSISGGVALVDDKSAVLYG